MFIDSREREREMMTFLEETVVLVALGFWAAMDLMGRAENGFTAAPTIIVTLSFSLLFYLSLSTQQICSFSYQFEWLEIFLVELVQPTKFLPRGIISFMLSCSSKFPTSK